MGKAVITGAGGGGAGSDECTATKAEVLKGYKAITKDSDDELIDGTLELTGTAADSQVLSGQTYYNTDVKTKRTGAMANRGAVSTALNAGGSYTIPAGFHNGSGKVTANGLSGQTSATAAAWHILSGQTAWVNGSKITGNMANQGTKTASLNCGSSYTIPAGYHNGSGKVTANSLSSQTGGATADDSKVLSGYTYWKDGAKRTGNLTVSSVVSFNAAQYSNLTLIASWAKPSKGPWSGVRIMCKQGSYPNSVSDGTLFYEGSATSATKTLAEGIWYLRAWNYMTTSVGRIYGGYMQTTANNQQLKGSQTFNASGTFTVPDKVTKIDVFCVGGGGNGGEGNTTDGGIGGSGGGGGYTVTKKGISVTPGQQISVNIGASEHPTSFGNYCTADYGRRGSVYWGAKGGSGGGGSTFKNSGSPAGNGGSDGSNGVGIDPGTGQGTTTRAFGESNGALFAGGGGGGGNNQDGVSVRGLGGAGGGGNGGDTFQGGSNGSYATGGGGGGGMGHGKDPGPRAGFSGGSGICIVRWGY